MVLYFLLDVCFYIWSDETANAETRKSYDMKLWSILKVRSTRHEATKSYVKV